MRAESVAGATEAMTVTLHERTLVASFREPVRACSWAIVGGGLVDASHVVWCEVRDTELRPPVDARRYLRDRIASAGLTRAVGLLTSRSVATYADASATERGIEARCLATVGLGNALRAGDPAGLAGRIGTINLLVHVSAPLTTEGLLEASAIATEAKSAAVLEAGIRSRTSGLAATGTGTDCVVATCARVAAADGGALAYAGKHTTVGSLVGQVVSRAVSAGIARWLAEREASHGRGAPG